MRWLLALACLLAGCDPQSRFHSETSGFGMLVSCYSREQCSQYLAELCPRGHKVIWEKQRHQVVRTVHNYFISCTLHSP